MLNMLLSSESISHQLLLGAQPRAKVGFALTLRGKGTHRRTLNIHFHIFLPLVNTFALSFVKHNSSPGLNFHFLMTSLRREGGKHPPPIEERCVMDIQTYFSEGKKIYNKTSYFH